MSRVRRRARACFTQDFFSFAHRLHGRIEAGIHAAQQDARAGRDRQGFALGLIQTLLPEGPIWFYQGMTLGYRTLYVWFEEDDILITDDAPQVLSASAPKTVEEVEAVMAEGCEARVVSCF